jgi:hypothetical protein
MEDMQIGTARNILARNDRIYAYVRQVPTQAGSALEPDRAFDVMERDQQLRQMAGSLFHFVPTDRAALICRMHLAQPFRNV